jgi:hypothetical protein
VVEIANLRFRHHYVGEVIEDPRVLSAIAIPSVTEAYHPPPNDEDGDGEDDDDEDGKESEEGAAPADDRDQCSAEEQQLQARLALQLATQDGQTVSEAVRRHEQLQLKYVLILDVTAASEANQRDSVGKLDVTLLYPAQALTQGPACADPLSPEGSLGSRFGLSSRTIEMRSNHSQIVAVKLSMLMPVHGFVALVTQYRDSSGQPLKKTNTFQR